MITAPTKSLSFDLAVALLSFAAFVSVLAAGGVLPLCRRIRSACRAAWSLTARPRRFLGDAASLGHGHIEIGFSDSSGDPLNHHGAVAWTPSGSAMRRVLVALAAGFHIKVR